MTRQGAVGGRRPRARPGGRGAALVARVSVVLLLAACGVSALAAQQRNQSLQVSTLTATVLKLDPLRRGLVCRLQDGSQWAVTVNDDVKVYDDLIVGDVVVIDYIDAIVVKVKPGATPANLTDITDQARSRVTDPLVKVDQQLTMVITIDEIDKDASAVVYHGPDTRRVVRVVRDPKLLDGIHPGDVVEVTMTRERAVSIERAK